MKRSDAIPLLLIVAAFLCAVVLVKPAGEFPLDDDWDFSATTWSLVQNGRIQHTPFTSATAYLQELWGAAWTLLFGPSFTILRISTLSLSLLATLLTYFVLRRTGAAAALALLGSLAFFFHPLFFWASFTYMTHVPTVVMSLLALLCFLAAARRGGWWIAIAIAVTIASFFTRQIGVLNALVPLIVLVSARGSKPYYVRVLAAGYAAALALFVVLMMGTRTLIASNAEIGMHTAAHRAPLDFLLGPPHYAFFNVQNAALFFLPLVVLCLAVRPSRAVIAGVAVVFGIVAVHMLWLRRPIPYFNSGNVFANLGLGPQTLRDVFTFRLPFPHHLGLASSVLLMLVSTVAAIFAGALLIANGFSRKEGQRGGSSEAELAIRYCAIYCIAGTVVISGMRLYFDRYSIDTMWPLAILLPLLALRRPPSAALATASRTLLVVVALFSIVYTAEYLAWNRARWEAFAFLRQSGVTLWQMDGGYEINAMLALQTGKKDLGKRGFAVADDEYILAFNKVPGYEVLREFPYPRLLGMGTGVVYAERRAGVSPANARPSRPRVRTIE